MFRAPAHRPVVIALLGCASLLLAFVGATGCGGARAPDCRVNADCASGSCLPSGVCATAKDDAPDASLSSADAGELLTSDASLPADAGGDAGTSDAASLGCVPNTDGTITRSEVPVRAGLHATFRIAQNATWNTAGTTQPDGSRLWDLSGALSGDQSVLVETTAVEGSWFASDFAGATYASRLSQSQDLLGVFEAGTDALLLRGVVSPQDGLYSTKVSYSPAVSVLAFPLAQGKTWTTDSTVSGRALGWATVYDERYDSKVDAHGRLKTPFGTFDVLRVQVVLTRTANFVTTTVRTYAFVAECFGTVATVVSQDNETQAEFTKTSEIRRLAP